MEALSGMGQKGDSVKVLGDSLRVTPEWELSSLPSSEEKESTDFHSGWICCSNEFPSTKLGV